MSILKLENVGYRYADALKDEYVLKNISWEFEKGKTYAIKGKSGSGKTTLLSLISGLETKYIGNITYNGKNLKSIDLDKETEGEIMKILKNLAKEEDKCIIIVTHSDNVAIEADEIYELKKIKYQKKND